MDQKLGVEWGLGSKSIALLTYRSDALRKDKLGERQVKDRSFLARQTITSDID